MRDGTHPQTAFQEVPRFTLGDDISGVMESVGVALTKPVLENVSRT